MPRLHNDCFTAEPPPQPGNNSFSKTQFSGKRQSHLYSFLNSPWNWRWLLTSDSPAWDWYAWLVRNSFCLECPIPSFPVSPSHSPRYTEISMFQALFPAPSLLQLRCKEQSTRTYFLGISRHLLSETPSPGRRGVRNARLACFLLPSSLCTTAEKNYHAEKAPSFLCVESWSAWSVYILFRSKLEKGGWTVRPSHEIHLETGYAVSRVLSDFLYPDYF